MLILLGVGERGWRDRSQSRERGWVVIGPDSVYEHGGCLSLLGCHNKMPQMGGLNNRNLFLTVLEAGKSQGKVPARLVSGEVVLLASQVAALPWCPLVAFLPCLLEERAFSLPLLMKPLIPLPEPTLHDSI